MGCASEASLVARGQDYLAQGQPQQAIETLLGVLETNPNSAPANLMLARVYFQLGRLDEAERTAELARRVESNEEVLVVLATIAYEKHDFAKAAGLMEQALKLQPDRATNHYRLGLIRREAGDLERAAEAFRMALVEQPTFNEAQVSLALTLKDLKRYDEALEVMQGVAKGMRGAGAQDAGVQATLGELYEAQNLVDRASLAYRNALKADATNTAAACGMARIYRGQQRFEEAIELLKGAARLLPKSAKVQLELGLTYRDFRLEAQAIEALQRATTLESPQQQAYAPLLELLERSKANKERLGKVLAAAAQALPDDARVQLKAGDWFADHADGARALKAFRRALEIEPNNAEAALKVGLTYVKANELEAAARAYDVLKYLDGDKADELQSAIDKAGSPAAPEPAAPAKAKRKGKRGRHR